MGRHARADQRFGREVTHLSVTALIYGPGDHFAAHSDGGDDDAPPASAARTAPIMSVRSSPGLLIAFAASMIHRVAPVAGGRRYSLAPWALATDG